jgi:hypothetical protein
MEGIIYTITDHLYTPLKLPTHVLIFHFSRYVLDPCVHPQAFILLRFTC